MHVANLSLHKSKCNEFGSHWGKSLFLQISEFSEKKPNVIWSERMTSISRSLHLTHSTHFTQKHTGAERNKTSYIIWFMVH